MKETILITVNYIIEIETHDFWKNDTGYLKDEIENSLKERFPMKIKIADNHYAKRDSLSYMPISRTKVNAMKCPLCDRWMTDKSKPNYISSLVEAVDIEGTFYCTSCEWETRLDRESEKYKETWNIRKDRRTE